MRKTTKFIFSTHAGGGFTDFLGTPRGVPDNPMSGKALAEPFRNRLAFAGWPGDKAKTVLARLQNVETAASVTSFFAGEA